MARINDPIRRAVALRSLKLLLILLERDVEQYETILEQCPMDLAAEITPELIEVIKNLKALKIKVEKFRDDNQGASWPNPNPQ